MNNRYKNTPVVAPGILRCPRMDECRERRMRWSDPPTTRVHPCTSHYRKGDWNAKDLVIWSVVLIVAVLALLVLWTPLMLAPLSEMLDAFHGLHRGQGV